MSAFPRSPRRVTVPLIVALCAFAINARAVGGIDLTSGNSVVNIDPFNPSSWVVDGQNQLYGQWFWYRTASQTREYSIDTMVGAAGLTLGRLNDGLPTTLNDTANAVGDVTWAFQWDSQIAAGGSLVIGKDKRLDVAVPEPAAVAMTGLGIALLLSLARRRLG